MNFNVHTTNLAGLQRQVSMLGLICIGLVVALVLAVGSLVTRHERIVVVPPGLAGPAAIDWGKADVEYMKAFGVFYSTLLGTITPGNAEYVADRLSAMTEPAAYAQIRKQILALSRDPSFSNSGATSNFVSRQVIYGKRWSPTFGSTRWLIRGNQPHQLSPRHHQVHLVEELALARSLGLALKFSGAQAHLLHADTVQGAFDMYIYCPCTHR